MMDLVKSKAAHIDKLSQKADSTLMARNETLMARNDTLKAKIDKLSGLVERADKDSKKLAAANKELTSEHGASQKKRQTLKEMYAKTDPRRRISALMREVDEFKELWKTSAGTKMMKTWAVEIFQIHMKPLTNNGFQKSRFLMNLGAPFVRIL